MSPTRERLLERIAAMAGRPVVMLVDLVVDRFITGTPKRISREAPVLILRHETETLTPGGGANAVANVAALGGRALPLGVVGDDESGRALVARLAEMGVETEGILLRPGYRTPTKTRILGGVKGAVKQQIVRYDVEDWLELDPSERRRFEELLTGWQRDADLATGVVSDYGYGTVEPALLAAVRRRLGDRARLLLDSRSRLGELDGCDGATPNQEEAEALLGRPLGDSLDEIDRSGRELAHRLGLRCLLITRGSRGMSLFAGGPSVHLPVHGTAQVADVTGAGDTVIATFSLALAAGAEPLEAALLADYAGGVVVMKMGTATLDAGELAEAVAADPRPIEELRWVGS